MNKTKKLNEWIEKTEFENRILKEKVEWQNREIEHLNTLVRSAHNTISEIKKMSEKSVYYYLIIFAIGSFINSIATLLFEK